jgi:glucose/arabinose dehydrogenase
MRGSWNAGTPVGYKVVRARFGADGSPSGFEDFLTGFIDENGGLIFGRPVGVAFTPDGSMLVSDDTNGAVYLVKYRGE